MSCWCRMRLLVMCAILFAGVAQAKERVIVTTDGEGDDKASLVRLLMYANEIDINGFIYSNSQFHHSDVSPIANHQVGANGWIEQTISQYEASLGNLRVHASGWPAGSQLRAVIRNGNRGARNRGFGNVYDNGAVGEGWDTDGSDLIIRNLLDGDSRRVWLQAWGGLSTIAQAFYRLRASYSQDQLNRALSKARVYAVVEQENPTPYGAPRYGTTGRNSEWLQRNFPSLKIIQPVVQPWLFAYMGDGVNPGRNMGVGGGSYADSVNPHYNDYIYQPSWYGSNVAGHGALGRHYRAVSSEGDSLAFFHVLDRGLRSFENPTWGGWGGRTRPVGVNFWTDAYDDGNRGKGFWRWVFDIQSDFGARMDWALYSNYRQANHPPVIASVSGSLRREVAPGQTVNLGVSASDPDGNSLTYRWYHYRHAGDDPFVASTIPVRAASSNNASLTVPANALGKEIHIIVEVKDNGVGHPMKTYRRFILDVTGNATSNPAPSPTVPEADQSETAKPDNGSAQDDTAAGENLLRNAGFEDGNTAPWRAWGSFSATRNGNARSGSWSAMIGAGSGGGSNVASVKPGGRYVFSAWGKGGSGARIGHKFFDSGFNQIGLPVYSSPFSANYERRSLTFTLPANAAYAQVFAWNSAGGAAYVDDVALIDEAGGTAAVAAPEVVPEVSVPVQDDVSGADNLLTNTGFEGGKLSPWSAWGSFYPANDGNARSGNWAVRVLPSNGGGTNVVAVQANRRYVFAAWGKAINGTGARLGVKFFDAAYQQIGDQQLSGYFSSTYKQQAVEFQTPGNTQYVQVFGWNNSAGSLYLDDLSLTAR
ncbi:MAG: nucleoside hydrolase-like domain-containing protein [Burkholderiaceae bacterium]